MTFIRRTLNQAERAENRRRAEQLRASGVEIESSDEWRENSRALEIVLAGPAENTVFETRDGGVVYAPLVHLVASEPVTLTGCDLLTGYDDQFVREPFDNDEPLCRLHGLEYRRCDLLNHRIENNLHLSRGQMVEGLILMTGLQPVPPKYGPLPVPFRLVFWDQFDNEYPVEGKVSVSRSAHRPRAGAGRVGSLDGPDATQKPRELSVGEESRLRHLELIAKEKRRGKPTPGGDS
ncbi:MAG: hypothetical protein WBM11_19365 [Terriglobales bacterium]